MTGTTCAKAYDAMDFRLKQALAPPILTRAQKEDTVRDAHKITQDIGYVRHTARQTGAYPERMTPRFRR
jgi:hypothetical protein